MAAALTIVHRRTACLITFRRNCHAHTPKQDALEILQHLPDNADIEEIMYRLYVLENIRRGQLDAEQGKTTDAEQLLKDIQTW